jgi:hypothetical protein
VRYALSPYIKQTRFVFKALICDNSDGSEQPGGKSRSYAVDRGLFYPRDGMDVRVERQISHSFRDSPVNKITSVQVLGFPRICG